jgi:hypothetical protein
MGQGIEDFTAALDTAPPWHWTRRASDTTIAAFIAERQGHALFFLSLSDSTLATAAVEHLRNAVDSYDSSYARPRAIHLPDLVGAYFRMGYLDTADHWL